MPPLEGASTDHPRRCGADRLVAQTGSRGAWARDADRLGARIGSRCRLPGPSFLAIVIPMPDGHERPAARASTPESIPIRRRDRAADDAWIVAFLAHAPIGVLALPTVDRQPPHVNSNLFVYDADEHALLFHTSRVGAMREVVTGGAPLQASFHAYTMGRLLPDVRALEFSVEYESVTAQGPVTVMDEPQAAEAALQRIMDKYAPHLQPHEDYETATAADLKRTSVYRLQIERWSGKCKAVAEDFPGAYLYEAITSRGAGGA